jgi:putative serine protease PepD
MASRWARITAIGAAAIVVVVVVGQTLALRAELDDNERALDRLEERLDESAADARRERDRLGEQLAATDQLLDTVNEQVAELTSTPDAREILAATDASVFTIVTPFGSGSGWVLESTSRRSRLITNFHVIEDVWSQGESAVSVERDDDSWGGEIVDADSDSDLAIIEVREEFDPLPLNTEALSPGDPIYVIGSPLGLEHSVSEGIVSSYRELDDLEWLQIDASVSPGNSGGPVIDDQGNVVGVTDWKVVADGAEGLSFAIPIERVCTALAVC